MKKIILKSFISAACLVGLTGCGDSWLETKYYAGVEADGALTTPTVIEYALNGVYYQLQRYYFAGNYSTMIGDVASDISYWNGQTGHFNALYQFTYQDTNSYLYYIWDYGYKVVDNAARVIEACENLLPTASASDAEDLRLMEAEARCLRAYAYLCMVNVFSHQAMVNGTSYQNEPGLVIVDTPIPAFEEVTRSTIGQTYDFLLNDLQSAISLFNQLGYDRGDVNYMNLAAAYGLQARANMYLENWSAAASAAQNALDVAGIDELTYTAEGYKALYRGGNSNTESFFTLGINSTTNWSANSCGTLYTTYGYSASPYLFSLFSDDDCRLSIYYWNEAISPDPYSLNFSGGKFGYYGGSNTAYATNYIVNAPEMFLIEAEAYANQGQLANAADALLVVAKRNNAITSTADLPSTADGILTFLHDERARELFQEGFRLYDLRRWNIACNLYAVGAPEIDWMITNATLGNVVLPIPADEINAGFGVTQNSDWSSTRPQ
ncbi:MAG: RagB/SusD family nutrient uptake outer membrane protein [Muribaculaceae bacterium]|nr:RagB/SusD family nutrient uptake outer membrane protein [Muribaculaceae bacterium]